MSEIEFLNRIGTQADSIGFNDAINIIEENYIFTAVAFAVGEQRSAAGENQGSCKLLAFAKLHQLSETATLHLFGDYYRKDVLENPEGDDHQNIRNFMRFGWGQVSFDGQALEKR